MKEENKANFFRNKYPDLSAKPKQKLRVMKAKPNSTSSVYKSFSKKGKMPKKLKRSCEASDRKVRKGINESHGIKQS